MARPRKSGQEKTTIQISSKLRAKLGKVKYDGMTYEDAIWMLIGKERQKKAAEMTNKDKATAGKV